MTSKADKEREALKKKFQMMMKKLKVSKKDENKQKVYCLIGLKNTVVKIMAEHKKRKKEKQCGKQGHDHDHDESCMMGEGAPVHDYDTEDRARKRQKK